MSDGVWNSMNGKTLVFYYHYNQSIGSDGDVILKSKDWPYTEAEWLAGAGASNPTCAVYQFYDSNGVKVDTNIADKPATISFALNRTGYNPEYVKAEIVKGDGVTAAEVLNLYYDPLSYTVIYADGVEEDEVFAGKEVSVYCDDPTPGFGDDPAREGYLFTGWADADGNAPAATVTGDVTYYAQWDEDNIGNPNNPEKKGPDGIADKYQKLVTFAVANGSWNTGSDANVVEVLTFYKSGVLSTDADATATMPAAPAVGEYPDTDFYKGYRSESWHAAIPTGDVECSDVLALYTYTYAAAYAVIYVDGANGMVFADQTTDNLLYGVNTPAFNGIVPARAGYVFVGWDKEIADKVTGNVTYTATWDEDVLGNDPVNPGSVEHPDGVADKYQLVVSYEAINGTINGIPRVALDKFDADGNHAVDGTAVLDAGQIPGTAPSVGFGPEGTWAPMAPIADMQLIENTDFVITYAATPVEPTNPDNPDEPTPPATPPTDSTNPTGPTGPTGPAVEPTPAPGPVAALATPIATATAAAAVEAIADDGNPLAAITALEAIDDDANALAAFEEIHCWTHWLMIFGALVTIVYGLGVLYARRHSARDMDDFEGDIMDGSRRYSARQASDPAANGAFQSM